MKNIHSGVLLSVKFQAFSFEIVQLIQIAQRITYSHIVNSYVHFSPSADMLKHC